MIAALSVTVVALASVTFEDGVTLENDETVLELGDITLSPGSGEGVDGGIQIYSEGIQINEEWFNITREDGSEKAEAKLWTYDPQDGDPIIEIQPQNMTEGVEYNFSLQAEEQSWTDEILLESQHKDKLFDVENQQEMQWSYTVENGHSEDFNFTLKPIGSIVVDFNHANVGAAGFNVYRNTTSDADPTEIESTTETGEIEEWDRAGSQDPEPLEEGQELQNYQVRDDGPDNADELYCYRVIAFGPGGISDASEEECRKLTQN